jgi:hypothetical protein
MEEILEQITTIIEDYNNTQNHNPEGLIDLGKNLSANLFYLEKYRAEYFKKHEGQKHLLINGPDKWNVNKAENRANFLYPQLYQLRRIMTSAYKVLDMIRSELSYIKTEMNNLHIS